MRQYKRLLEEILKDGEVRRDRTGVGTLGVFGRQMRFDLSQGFPILTTKRVHFKSVLHELLWFISGNTNVGYLRNHGVTIWDEWADERGELGPVYGKQWRSWDTPKGVVDQLAGVIEQLRTNPYGRRHVVTAWNPADIPEMALPPCHCMFQFYVSTSGELSCQMYQRSADVFLGVPFNIASYALLTHMAARASGLKPGHFVHVLGDAHLYLNHLEQAKEQLSREERPLPRLVLDESVTNLFDFRAEHVSLAGYDPHPPISAPIAV